MDKRIIGVAAAVIIVSGAFYALRSPGADPAPAAVDRLAGELAPDQVARLGIRTEAAVPGTLPVATVPAQVSLPPEARVAVTSPFAGVVTQVLVIPGQQVARGQALALVRAAEPVQFGAELARAEADLPVLRASAARLSQLAREGIIAPARADEAQAALRRGEATAAEQQRLLAMAHFCFRSSVIAVFSAIGHAEFIPHAVDDAEGDREAEAEYPREIPHGVMSSVEVGVGADIGEADPAEHDLEGPTGVGQHDRQEDHGDNQHDPQRQVA